MAMPNRELNQNRDFTRYFQTNLSFVDRNINGSYLVLHSARIGHQSGLQFQPLRATRARAAQVRELVYQDRDFHGGRFCPIVLAVVSSLESFTETSASVAHIFLSPLATRPVLVRHPRVDFAIPFARPTITQKRRALQESTPRRTVFQSTGSGLPCCRVLFWRRH